jgi:hypothetical protein
MSLELNETKMLEAFETYKYEIEKFKGGNMSAAARARKPLAEICKLAKAMRANISDKKNNGKGAKKKSKKKS